MSQINPGGQRRPRGQTTSETVVFDWLQRAEGDAFKTLSKKMR